MSGLSALRRSGRFMVMVSRPLSRFCRTISLAVMDVAFVVVRSLYVVIALVGWVSPKGVTHLFCCRGWRSGGLRFANPPYSFAATLRASFLHQRAPRCLQRLERLVAGHGRDQLVIVPAALRLR